MAKAKDSKGEIVIFKPKGAPVSLEIRLENDSLWLTQDQISKLFKRERSVISKHIKSVFTTKELDEKRNVQKMHIPFSDKPITFYNLDVVLSVGYRVNSKQGTQFRIWATGVLRDHLVKGLTMNDRRLKELHQAVHLISEVAERRDLSSDEAKALLKVVKDYTFALNLLDDYDHQRVTFTAPIEHTVTPVTYEEATKIIGQLRHQFHASELFGLEKDKSLHGSLDNIFQTFSGNDLYPSIEEKAAHLLYFLVKNHSFVDGNKRIAAALFLWFLEKNKILYRPDGSKRIAENALVAMTLLIAESRPAEKGIITQVIANLLNEKTK